MTPKELRAAVAAIVQGALNAAAPSVNLPNAWIVDSKVAPGVREGVSVVTVSIVVEPEAVAMIARSTEALR